MNQAISRRKFMMNALIGSSVASAAHGLQAFGPAEHMEEDPSPFMFPLEAFAYRGVRLLEGMLKRQYDATRSYYYNIPDNDILKGFRKRAGLPAPGNDTGAWGREDTSMVFGQWLSGMARMYRATGDEAMRDKAAYLVREWAKTITPDGASYYPTLAKELRFSHYAWDKLVYGLVDLYEYCGDKEAIPLLERITAWAMTNLDRSRQPATPTDIQGISPEWYTLSENLYRAYKLTGDTRYRSYGDLWRYPQYWGMFTGKHPLDPQGLHGYSHVNTFSSAAMTYVLTGEPEYLQTLVNAYDYFQENQCYATGGYGPAERLVAAGGALGETLEREANTFETPCGSWAVFKLARYLMRFTGQARFGDWMETLVYNGIGAALLMAAGGKTFYYSDYRLGSDYPIGSARKVYYWDPYPCCAGTYIQAVADFHNIIYFKDARGLYVNLFIPSEVTWNHNGAEIKVVQETSYPESETTSFTIEASKNVAFEFKFRVPGWSQGVTVEVNDSRPGITCRPGDWASIRRMWQSGDRVIIQFPMQLRRVPIDKQHPHRVAIMYGPVAIVQDGRYTTGLNRARSESDLSKLLVPTDRPLAFRIADMPQGPFAPAWGEFMPFYRMGHEVPYRMYFDLLT